MQEKNLDVRQCALQKTQYRKFETYIPTKGIVRPPPPPQSQFPHSCVCDRFLYSHGRSAYSAAGKYVDRSWVHINRSQTHECGNWYWGRAIPFLGIHKWDFRCRAVPITIIYILLSMTSNKKRTFIFLLYYCLLPMRKEEKYGTES